MCLLSGMVCNGAVVSYSRHPSLYRADALGYAGILRLELSKDVLERTGLNGRPIRSGGRKHTKERYCR